MITPMKRVLLYIRPAQAKSLAKIVKETGVPRAEIMRRALDHYLPTIQAAKHLGLEKQGSETI